MAMTQGEWSPRWRRMDCLGGCGLPVKRSRDAWLELGGTRDGSWLIASRVGPGRMYGDPMPPPVGQSLFILGAVHRECLQRAYQLLRAGRALLREELPLMSIDSEVDSSELDFLSPTLSGTCPFCQDPYTDLSKEDVHPKWLLRELKDRGARVMRGGHWSNKVPALLAPVCTDCNTTWMSTLENDAKIILMRLFSHDDEILSSAEIDRIGLWAAKMAILFDVASGQPVIPRGFGHDLNIRRSPHKDVRVWMAAYAGERNVLGVLKRPLYTLREDFVGNKGEPVMVGWCVTFAVLGVVFQVLTPFYPGNLGPLETFRDSVLQVWPRGCVDMKWPPKYQFDHDSIEALSVRVNNGIHTDVMDVTLRETRSFGGQD